MRRSFATLLVLVGCTGGGELDIDVDIGESSVFVVPRELDRSCTCTFGFRSLGSCGWGTDVLACDCSPPPGSCITGLELWRGARLIERHEPDWGALFAYGAESVSLPPWEDREDMWLRITGCGGEARIPVGGEPPPVPSIEQVTIDQSDSLRVEWATPEPVDSVQVGVIPVVAGVSCHRASISPAILENVPGSGVVGDPSSVTLTTRVGGENESSPLGVVRTWKRAGVRVSMVVPGEAPLHRGWQLQLDPPVPASATVQGQSTSLDVGYLELALDQDEVLVSLYGNATGPQTGLPFAYESGPAGDRFTMSWPPDSDSTFSGELPRSVLHNDAWGTGEPVEVTVDSGPVTLTSTTDPAQTIEVRLVFEAMLGRVARPQFVPRR